MSITLRQLSVFEAVARLGSVSGAAEELHMSQSAASMALQNLEKALAARLFIRGHRALMLSEAGRRLQPLAASMLVAADEMRTAVGEDSSSAPLRIGVSPTVGDYLFDDVCGAFMAENPGVRLGISVLPAFDVISRVDEMALDLGLVEFVSLRRTLDVMPWGRGSLTVFCSPDHPLAGRRNLLAEDLSPYSWCLQHRFADSRRQFTLAMLNRVASMDIVLESDSVNIIKAVVAAGDRLGCLPRPCLEAELHNGRLVELDVSGLDLTIPFSLVTRKDLRRSSALNSFVEFILRREP
ncbi:LysR family transcriptional regulator [Nocardioides campestrisoli]|uniref:LysR family transcriptional regulator n=1 Tax=Nocardioides campestrisoli TaxID=2736757 RepID=UPI00163D565E|nr:LysR substrate-binding domain-containing protein [Nocardioides campestrisoli]